MTAITSIRPFSECDPEWKRNQLLAKRFMEMAFSRIIIFGETEPEMKSPKTFFIESEPWPTIKSMAEEASHHNGFTAILNADICVTPEIKKLERMMMFRGKVCASSRRWHFDPETCDYAAAELGNDRGRDIFIARRDVWRNYARVVPSALRIGNARWDAHATDYFRGRHDEGFIDFTASKMVYHPRHEGRKRPYDAEIAEAYPR
jgi:hypothetical protein